MHLIKRKIEKLIRLATNNPNSFESSQAFSKALKLSTENNITIPGYKRIDVYA